MMMKEMKKETLVEDIFVATKTSWSLNKKKNQHQIVTTAGDQDHIEGSLPSSLMEEEEEEHVQSFNKTQI